MEPYSSNNQYTKLQTNYEQKFENCGDIKTDFTNALKQKNTQKMIDIINFIRSQARFLCKFKDLHNELEYRVYCGQTIQKELFDEICNSDFIDEFRTVYELRKI